MDRISCSNDSELGDVYNCCCFFADDTRTHLSAFLFDLEPNDNLLVYYSEERFGDEAIGKK